MWLLCAMALAGSLPNEMPPAEALHAMSPRLGATLGMDSRTRDREVGIHWTVDIPDTGLSLRTSVAIDRALAVDSVALVPFAEGRVVGVVGAVAQNRGPQFRQHMGAVLGLGLQGPKRRRVQPHAELTTNPMWSMQTGRSSHALRLRMGLTWSPFDPRSRKGG